MTARPTTPGTPALPALLPATADGPATAPRSDAAMAWPRHLPRGLPADAGVPSRVVRLGDLDAGEALPPASRRDPGDVITTQQTSGPGGEPR
jgi:hypothetical protein